MKVFGVTLDEKIARADRPYVFVKLETNQGVVGWGEATLEGKAAAAMACVNDLKDLIIGSDPMQVEHLYQLMYIGSFYRGGPVLGSAISGIDQALWDIRGKVMGMPVYEMLGGPVDPRGVRGYYHASAWTLAEARELARQDQGGRRDGAQVSIAGPARMGGNGRQAEARREAYGDAARRAWAGPRFRRRLPRAAEPDGGGDHSAGDRAASSVVRRGGLPAGEHLAPCSAPSGVPPPHRHRRAADCRRTDSPS